ncbi:VAMP1 [Hibiscus syriacus]|uniref:VAMP1 n=1 Tax=Hibiscus syriacus TaxID=106335 RepID=A0A6A2Y2P6_HIBSY|nr:transcription initiation factor TFIID subunit 8-like [Hibiscus syriacus]KAE8669766.1 VAMP1 [Hibiscus syriacus]
MTKPKSRRKSNTQQEEATNPSEFSFNITRVAVAQICKSVGFRRSQVTTLNTLTLVATKYLETLARSAASFSNAANRGQSNLLDITNALHDASLQLGFNGAATLYGDDCLLKSAVLEDLCTFVNSTDEIPFAKPIERPKERETGDSESSPENLQRGGHVPEWLPGFPDVGNLEQCDKRVCREILWESVLGHQNEGFEEKRDGKHGGKLSKERTRVKFCIKGDKRMHTNGFSVNNLFTQSIDEEAETEHKLKMKQTLVYQRKKKL